MGRRGDAPSHRWRDGAGAFSSALPGTFSDLLIVCIKHTGNCGGFPANPSSSTDEHAPRKMSTFAYWLVAAARLRWLTASAPFHVCERSGFSPDRADYLSRQAKLNFTSLERHHKASLSGSPPRSPNEPTPTHTHTHRNKGPL